MHDRQIEFHGLVRRNRFPPPASLASLSLHGRFLASIVTPSWLRNGWWACVFSFTLHRFVEALFRKQYATCDFQTTLYSLPDNELRRRTNGFSALTLRNTPDVSSRNTPWIPRNFPTP